MAGGPIKIKSIDALLANGVSTNVLNFKEDFMMDFTPQFMPNYFQGLGVLEKAKWRVINFTLDSDSDVFDFGFSVGGSNSALGIIWSLAYDTGTTEPSLGETLTGDISGATGVVVGWTVTGGTWALNTAAGVIYLAAGTLTFNGAETVDGSVGGDNMITTTATETKLFAALPYDSGSTEFTVGDTLTGNTGGATGVVQYWTVTSGTWAGTNAAGVVYLSTISTTDFQAEDLNSGLGPANIASATGPEAAVFAVTFVVADAAGTIETWTYTATKSYVQRKEFGRIEDGATRNTVEYQIVMYGVRVIS